MFVSQGNETNSQNVRLHSSHWMSFLLCSRTKSQFLSCRPLVYNHKSSEIVSKFITSLICKIANISGISSINTSAHTLCQITQNTISTAASINN